MYIDMNVNTSSKIFVGVDKNYNQHGSYWYKVSAKKNKKQNCLIILIKHNLILEIWKIFFSYRTIEYWPTYL